MTDPRTAAMAQHLDSEFRTRIFDLLTSLSRQVATLEAKVDALQTSKPAKASKE